MPKEFPKVEEAQTENLPDLVQRKATMMKVKEVIEEF